MCRGAVASAGERGRIARLFVGVLSAGRRRMRLRCLGEVRRVVSVVSVLDDDDEEVVGGASCKEEGERGNKRAERKDCVWIRRVFG